MVGYYTPPGGFPDGKDHIVVPLSCFLKKDAPLQLLRSRDVRFHDLSYPVRDMRIKQQHQAYNDNHAPMSEEQYRQLIFSEDLPPGSDTEAPADPHVERDIIIDDLGGDIEITGGSTGSAFRS